MDQQTMGWVLLGAAVLILALLIYLLTQVKKSCQNDISTQLQRLQSDLERSVQAIYSMKNLASLLATDDGEDQVVRRLEASHPV